MRTWDWFFPDVLPEVLGCPEPTAERHIQRAAMRFCAESTIWRADLDRILTRADRASYDISYPTGAEGVKLLAASLDGYDIGIEAEDGSTSLGQRLRGNVGRDRVFSSDDLVSVTVMPTPAGERELVLRAALQPTEGATGLENRIADKWRTDIANGALATLLAMNRQPWSNPSLAAVKEGLFREAIGKAKSVAFKASTNKAVRNRAQFY